MCLPDTNTTSAVPRGFQHLLHLIPPPPPPPVLVSAIGLIAPGRGAVSIGTGEALGEGLGEVEAEEGAESEVAEEGGGGGI